MRSDLLNNESNDLTPRCCEGDLLRLPKNMVVVDILSGAWYGDVDGEFVKYLPEAAPVSISNLQECAWTAYSEVSFRLSLSKLVRVLALPRSVCPGTTTDNQCTRPEDV